MLERCRAAGGLELCFWFSWSLPDLVVPDIFASFYVDLSWISLIFSMFLTFKSIFSIFCSNVVGFPEFSWNSQMGV